MKLAFRAAVLTLELIERRGLSFEKAFKEAIAKANLRSYYTLAYKYAKGTLMKVYLADHLLESNKLSDIPLRRKCAFRVALYLTLEEGLNEDELNYLAGGLLSSKLIMLISKAKDAIELNETEVIKLLSLRYSHPYWLVKELSRYLDYGELTALLKANERSVTWVRVNLLKTDEERAVRKLEREGVSLEKDKDFEGVYKVLTTRKPLSKLKLIREGEIVVQDKGSIAVVYALEPSPGDVILDACAAPGMKTTLMAQLMEDRGSIIAIDISDERLAEMKHLLKRYGAQNVKLIRGDSRSLPLVRGRVTKALVDAPCSNSGAIRNDPALRITLRDENSVKLWSTIQRSIIRGVIRAVEGEIVYSTCSLSAKEGEEIIADVIRGGEGKCIRPRIKGSEGFRGYPYSSRYVRLFPHIHDCIGFFISKIIAY